MPGTDRAIRKVAFNMRERRGPWGGSSAFVAQLSRFLTGRGCETTCRLEAGVDCIVIVDPRENLEGKAFGVDAIEDYKRRNPGVRVLHRVNECDQRKATGFMDLLLRDANYLADGTVFISEWLRDYHAERWFDVSRPHWTVYNGADDRWFHPRGVQCWDGMGPFRIVTHHWSANPMKGFGVYEEVDRLIADGRLPGVELWVIGRWPEGLVWRAARTFPACAGAELAGLLRQCHAYLTASLWEPCGMHHVEGAQCGLPLIYHEDGGGIVEAGRRYGVGFRDDVAGAIRATRDGYAGLRKRVMEKMPSGDRMCAEYEEVIRRLAGEEGKTL